MTPHVLDADQLQRQKLALYEEKINSSSHRMRGRLNIAVSVHILSKRFIYFTLLSCHDLRSTSHKHFLMWTADLCCHSLTHFTKEFLFVNR